MCGDDTMTDYGKILLNHLEKMGNIIRFENSEDDFD